MQFSIYLFIDNQINDKSLEVFSKCINNRLVIKKISISCIYIYIYVLLFLMNIDNNFSENGINMLCSRLGLLKNLESISFYGYNISNYDSLVEILGNNNLMITI